MATSAPHNPPFRADHVGSLLRPAELIHARAEHEAGKISAQQLRVIEDDAIRKAVALQEEVGLQSITDGEYRRGMFFGGFYGAVGVRFESSSLEDGYFIDRKGEKVPLVVAKVNQRIRWNGPIHAGDFKFIQSLTSFTPKITIPSPVYAHFRAGRANISKDVYPDLDSFWDDIVAAYRKELGALAEAGCRYVQLDDTPLPFLCDTRNVWEQIRRRGDDPRKLLLETYPHVINQCLVDRPAGLHVAMHMCRGNNQGHWGAEGGYDILADTLFNQINVDSYFMEYDTPRAGSFEPLRLVPKKKTVVLGLVSTKVGAVESREELKRRIEEAGKFIDLDQLSLSPQCGFASTAPGNPITPESQAAKLRLVVQVAREVWG
jgi:methionine synthase II (cobalamin-independent)